MKTLWFKRKTYGWGWTPCTWQGWGITIAYVVILITLGIAVDPNHHPEFGIVFLVVILILTVLFIYVAYKTGEKPRWQWGKDDTK
jgi:peptidoglycan/LPS O-acetylase OafA/YrhL